MVDADAKGAAHYCLMIGRVNWAITLGHHDVQHVVSALSCQHWRNDDVPLNTEEGQVQELEGIRESLIHAHITILNYTLQFGYSYHRWKVVVNIIIQKDPGSIKIHRLHVIHIYEADYNLLLGVKWREAMHLSKDN
jgi:hypothetical protein